ncbi:MAG: 50S ribosomal protein L25/general stress protein Ctc [Candidatus Omnitrophica bacterium]|nr:50S ribosomal protein L25/general stress protein Ctc [Candidatus Omnitrophota bacterium]
MAKGKAAIEQALVVTRRSTQGKRRVERLRQEGLVPGVVYGRNLEPMPIAVNDRELTKLLRSKTGEHALVTLRLDGERSWEKPALVQAVQHDPVNGRVIHIDFHAILLTERLRVKVPVVLKGEAVGVKQDGGLLEHFLREIEVECLPAEMPEHVEFDVSLLKIGETVHVRDLAAPHNTKITSDPEGVIVSVHMPKVEKVEEEAAPVTEPEVIREKKEEGEAATAEEGKAEKKTEKPEAKEAKKDAK